MTRIAALFVETDGPYFGLDDVDPWDVVRDARLYNGPHAVVAHPPCERWGRYATGGPNPNARRRTVGDDDGCFLAALRAVIRYGGVLEHPEATKAWAHHEIVAPPRNGGWVCAAPRYKRCFPYVWTCCVEQGNYGHVARKPTWLYVSGLGREQLPELKWGPAPQATRLEEGFHSKEEAKAARSRPDWVPRKRLSKEQRVHTPLAFRDALIDIARRIEANKAS